MKKQPDEIFLIKQILLEIFYCIWLSQDVAKEQKERISNLLLQLSGIHK